MNYIILIMLSIISFGCTPHVHDSDRILKQVADLMNVSLPDARPWVFIVSDGYAVSNIAAPYVWSCGTDDTDKMQGVFIPPCLIYLSKKDLSEALVAHEFAHFLGADEREAERIQVYFDSKTGDN